MQNVAHNSKHLEKLNYNQSQPNHISQQFTFLNRTTDQLFTSTFTTKNTIKPAQQQYSLPLYTQTIKYSLCLPHNINKLYYCQLCQQSICSDCIIINKQHYQHQIVRLNEVQNKFNMKMTTLSEKMCNKKLQISNAKQRMIEQQINSKNSIQLNTLNILMKNLYQRVSNKINSLADKCNCNLLSQQSQLDKFSQQYNLLITKLQKCSKSDLLLVQGKQIETQLNRSESLLQNQICNVDIKQLEALINMGSQLVPQYQSRKFLLDNYTSIRERKDFIYSEVFYCQGLEWRLKIYPNGLQQSGEPKNELKKRKSISDLSFKNDSYLSIFIELKSGLQKIGRYRHKLQIINQNNPNLKLSRQFQSEFESGQCWGYNSYARIQTLYDESYVHPKEDYLQIILHVGPPSYYHATLDQQVIIQDKIKKITQNQRKIALLNQILINHQLKSHENIVQKHPITPQILKQQNFQGDKHFNFLDFVAIIDLNQTSSEQEPELNLDLMKIYNKTQINYQPI